MRNIGVGLIAAILAAAILIVTNEGIGRDWKVLLAAIGAVLFVAAGLIGERDRPRKR